MGGGTGRTIRIKNNKVGGGLLAMRKQDPKLQETMRSSAVLCCRPVCVPAESTCCSKRNHQINTAGTLQLCTLYHDSGVLRVTTGETGSWLYF